MRQVQSEAWHILLRPRLDFAPLGKASLPQKRNVKMVRQFAVSAEGIMCKPRDCAAVDMEGRTLLERRQSRHRLTHDQRMNVVRALVGVNALQVRHVPHRAILGENSVRPQQPTRLPSYISRNVDIVALRK